MSSYPLPNSYTSTSLAGECKKAQRILDSFINPDLVTIDKQIPRKFLENAKGLVIFTVFELGMMRSIRFGSGLVVARLPNGTWSAPSAIATGKHSSRGQFGMEHTEYLYLLNTEAAVEKFRQGQTFTLGEGEGASIAPGPFGRIGELEGDSDKADIFAYCKTRTVFGGSTLEGVTIGERADANRKLYQESVDPHQLLRGEATPPAETYPLMKILHSPLVRPVPTGRTRAASLGSLESVVKQGPQTVSPIISPVTSPATSPVSPVDSPVASPAVSPATSPVISPVISPVTSPITPPVVHGRRHSSASSSPITMPILPPAVHGRRHSSAASAPPQIRRQSSALTLAVEGPRFYEQRRMTNPHKITIEITDCSNIELPRSLTESPEVESPVDESPPTDRTSLDRDLDLRPGTYPAVLRAGRRTWSGTSTADWSRHDPLHF